MSALIILIGFELGVSSVKKILHPEPTDFTLLTAVILLVSIAVKLWMAAFNRGLGKKIRSTALTATAMDSRNDVIATATVLAASVFAHFTHIEVDGYAGAAVAAFILISGAGLAKDTISPLLGEAADPELQHAVVNEIKNCPSVLGIHDLMVHDYGPGQRFASVHVEMDAREDPLLCHDLIDDIERACKEKHNVHLVIHYDPVVTDDEEINHMHTEVAEILTSLDDRLTIHDFRMVRGPGHNNLIFDVSIPFECKGKGPIIKKELDAAIAAREEKTYYTVITFDQAEC